MAAVPVEACHCVTIPGLAPVWEVAHVDSQTVRFEYKGARVVVVAESPDSGVRREERTYARPMFNFEMLDDLIRSLPLREDYSAVLPLYSEPSRALELDTARVVGRDTAGSWTVQFLDSSSVVTYRVDGKTRRLLAHEVLNRQTGQAARLEEVLQP